MSKLLNIELANATVTSAATNDIVNLGNIVRKHCCLCNNVPTFSYNNLNAISLNQPGYYLVTVNATFTGDAGNATLTLNSNGINIPYAGASETITTANTEYRSISFTTAVRVLPNAPIILTVKNNGVTLSVNTINVDIVKIC